MFINYKKNLNVIRFLITFFAVKQMCLSCEFKEAPERQDDDILKGGPRISCTSSNYLGTC